MTKSHKYAKDCFQKLTDCLFAAVLALAATHSNASAQSGEELVAPEPTSKVDQFVGEVSLLANGPIVADGICSETAGCAIDIGGGFGLGALWHISLPWFLRASYEVTFHGSGTVFELATFQSLGLGARYHFLSESLAHPVLAADVSFVALGDTFQFDTVGGAIDVGAGVEIELSHSISTNLLLYWRTAVLARFTGRDGIQRSDPPLPNVFFGLRASLYIHQ